VNTFTETKAGNRDGHHAAAYLNRGCVFLDNVK